MLPGYFAFVSTAIASLGSLHYLILTFRGKVQPNRVTFFFWGLFPLIIFFAQYDAGVSSVVWITLTMGLIPFGIVLASLVNQRAYWKIKNRDYFLALIAIVSMVGWYLTNDPLLAIILSIVADFFAGLPTLIKAYTAPYSEDWRPYTINAFGFLVGTMAVQQWVFAEYSFVLYLFMMTSLFALIIYIRQRMVVATVTD